MATQEDIRLLEKTFSNHSKTLHNVAEQIVKVGQNIRHDNFKLMEQMDKIITRMSFACNKNIEQKEFHKVNPEIERIYQIMNQCVLNSMKNNVETLAKITKNTTEQIVSSENRSVNRILKERSDVEANLTKNYATTMETAQQTLSQSNSIMKKAEEKQIDHTTSSSDIFTKDLFRSEKSPQSMISLVAAQRSNPNFSSEIRFDASLQKNFTPITTLSQPIESTQNKPMKNLFKNNTVVQKSVISTNQQHAENSTSSSGTSTAGIPEFQFKPTTTNNINSTFPRFNFVAPSVGSPKTYNSSSTIGSDIFDNSKNCSTFAEGVKNKTTTEKIDMLNLKEKAPNTQSSILDFSFSFSPTVASTVLAKSLPLPTNVSYDPAPLSFRFKPPTFVKEEHQESISSGETCTTKLDSAQTTMNNNDDSENPEYAEDAEDEFDDYENINSDGYEEDQLLLEANCMLTTQDAYVSPMKAVSSTSAAAKCNVQVFESSGVIFITFTEQTSPENPIVSHYVYRSSKLSNIVGNRLEYLASYSNTSETKKLMLEFNDLDSLNRFVAHFNDGVQMANELEFDDSD